jgi:hypothetical protein
MVTTQMRPYDGVTLGIERHSPDGRPVSRVAGPSCRVEFARLKIHLMSCSKYCMIVPCMALGRTDVTNSAVTMIEVVPANETSRPGAGLVGAGKAFGRKLGPVLGGTKQRLGISVVVTAALNELDPAGWLRSNLEKLPTCLNSEIDSLLPLRHSPLLDHAD